MRSNHIIRCVLSSLVAVLAFDALKANENFHVLQFPVNSLLESVSTAVAPDAKNNGESGSRGRAQEACTE